MYRYFARLLPPSPVRSRRSIGSMTPVWLFGAALGALVGVPGWAAEPLPAGGAVAELIAPYAVGCGGKSECGATDQLEIKPIGAAKALQSVCLRLAGASCAAPEMLAVYNPDPARPAAAMVPLAPQVERWLKHSEQALRDAARASLPVELVLTDVDGKAFKSGFMLNLSALWSNGALPLRISSVECASCGPHSLLTLHVPQLATWALATKSDPAKLSLLLGGTKMPGTPLTPGDGTLSFRLERQSDSVDGVRAWNAVMREILADDDHAIRVGVADDKGTLAMAGGKTPFAVSSHRLAWSLLVCAAVIAVLIWLGRVTGWAWVRDSYALPDGVATRREMPFSLGRSQMLFWTVIVLTAWLLVGLAAGDWAGFNESSWILMGVGAGTVLGSVSTGMPPVLEKLIAAYRTAQEAQPPDIAAIEAAAAALRKEVCSRSWWSDVSSDYGEIQGLHRMQSLLFTVLIGGYFLIQAYLHGAMPDLSTNVLALLGISGGAYVGFKLAGK